MFPKNPFDKAEEGQESPWGWPMPKKSSVNPTLIKRKIEDAQAALDREDINDAQQILSDLKKTL